MSSGALGPLIPHALDPDFVATGLLTSCYQQYWTEQTISQGGRSLGIQRAQSADRAQQAPISCRKRKRDKVASGIYPASYGNYGLLVPSSLQVGSAHPEIHVDYLHYGVKYSFTSRSTVYLNLRFFEEVSMSIAIAYHFSEVYRLQARVS